MNNNKTEWLVATNFDLDLASPISDEKLLDFFGELRRDFEPDGISNFIIDKESEFYRLNRGDHKKIEDDFFIKATKGQKVQVAWGPSTSFEAGLGFTSRMLKALAGIVKPIQISTYAQEFHFEVPAVGNHQETILKKLYRPETIHDCISDLGDDEKEFKPSNSSIHVLFSCGDDVTGAIKVLGQTTLREIMSGEYDNDPIKCFFGAQSRNRDVNFDSLTESITSHANWAFRKASGTFFTKVCKGIESNKAE